MKCNNERYENNNTFLKQLILIIIIFMQYAAAIDKKPEVVEGITSMDKWYTIEQAKKEYQIFLSIFTDETVKNKRWDQLKQDEVIYIFAVGMLSQLQSESIYKLYPNFFNEFLTEWTIYDIAFNFDSIIHHTIFLHVKTLLSNHNNRDFFEKNFNYKFNALSIDTFFDVCLTITGLIYKEELTKTIVNNPTQEFYENFLKKIFPLSTLPLFKNFTKQWAYLGFCAYRKKDNNRVKDTRIHVIRFISASIGDYLKEQAVHLQDKNGNALDTAVKDKKSMQVSVTYMIGGAMIIGFYFFYYWFYPSFLISKNMEKAYH